MGDDFVHGINKMKKPSTKVMAPPGGQSQINLFAGSAPAAAHQVNRNQAHRNQSSIFGGEPEQKAPPRAAPVSAAAPAPAPSAQPASKAATQPVPSNSITAPPKNPTAPGGGRSSTKVMAPPGGKTSVSFG